MQALAAQAGAIAIDGQVAAGKTVVGRELARRLGCPYLDTGIMYRAITWLALRREVSTNDAPALGDLTRSVSLRLKGPEGDSILLTTVKRNMNWGRNCARRRLTGRYPWWLKSLKCAGSWCVSSGPSPPRLAELRAALLWWAGTSARWSCPMPPSKSI